MLICIEGIDGAGKTHASKLLVELLGSRGLRTLLLNRTTMTFGDGFSSRRIDALRSVLWPYEPEPPSDPFGTRFYLFLLAAWYAAQRQFLAAATGFDVIVADGSFYRVIAKAHARSGLDMAWLRSLFAGACQPDLVALLDIDPAVAWQRRTSFKATELGRWDGIEASPQHAFCVYQGEIRRALSQMANELNWTVVSQTATTSPAAIAGKLDELVWAKLRDAD